VDPVEEPPDRLRDELGVVDVGGVARVRDDLHLDVGVREPLGHPGVHRPEGGGRVLAVQHQRRGGCRRAVEPLDGNATIASVIFTNSRWGMVGASSMSR
jgi:hypothetical protein